jgi:xanthine dehydrogenase YagR molybdenum-binding subunit
VALVVAETLERAREAATLVRVEYDQVAWQTDLGAGRAEAFDADSGPAPRGDTMRALARAAVRHEADYCTQIEHHNPMEMHATTVIYDGDRRLTIWDKTQGVLNSAQYVARIFGLPRSAIRLRSPFVGGAFGSGLRPQYQLFLAVLAALQLKRSVRVELSRPQMFTFGHRPATRQRVTLGATTDGCLTAIQHEAITETSRFEQFAETIVPWSGELYHCENVVLRHRLIPLDIHTPLDMRAPGAAVGLYALECAMDELAAKLGIDPIELRLRNYAERDGNTGKPFSSKSLREAYRVGADRFGWQTRPPAPRSMVEGGHLIGWGWPVVSGRRLRKRPRREPSSASMAS